ncbi:MAG: glycosyltransferase family 9 protein [Helicobacteraceae bacterium]|nr:glycosyltransferase family 9 protein [Helicobacteraceae bacterium]
MKFSALFKRWYWTLAPLHFEFTRAIYRIFAFKRITIKAPDALGDTVMYTSAIDEIKRAKPTLSVTVATNQPLVFLRNPNVDRVIKQRECGLLFLDFSLKMWQSARDTHRALLFAQLFLRNRQSQEPNPQIFLADEEIEAIRAHLPQSFIAVNPNSRYQEDMDMRAWGFERYQEVARLMSDIAFVQLGSKNDPLLANAIDFRGCDERRSAAIIKLSKAGLFHDCDTMHLARAVNRPSVVIWGSTSPLNYGYTLNDNVTPPPEIDCHPCFGKKFSCDRHKACLAAITPQTIAMRLRRLCEAGDRYS